MEIYGRLTVAVPVPKGAIFTVSTGEYSDYSIHGVFRATEEIDVEAYLVAWLAKHPNQKDEFKFDERAFLASMLHLMEPVDCWNIHLGDYSNYHEVDTSHYETFNFGK